MMHKYLQCEIKFTFPVTKMDVVDYGAFGSFQMKESTQGIA